MAKGQGKRQMTEEQKKAAAERLNAARQRKAEERAAEQAAAKAAEHAPEAEETAPAEDPRLAALEAQNEAMRRQMEDMRRELNAGRQPQVIHVAADTERVHFLWQAPVSDNNVVLFGEGGMYGRITGRTGSFFVPKNDLSRILDSQVRIFLDRRWLIVLDGLNEDEREALGVNYRPGEILDKRAFAHITELGDELLEVYPGLCASHKEIVGKRWYEAWKAGDGNVTRARTEALLRMTREAGLNIGGFAAVIEGMNRAVLAE